MLKPDPTPNRRVAEPVPDGTGPPDRLLRLAPPREDKLTHYLFRYPAKFHPPVVATLLQRYTKAGDVVLDPFVGSGTLLIEGTLLDRECVGIDVDPVAVMASRAKTARYDLDDLNATVRRLLTALEPHDRGEDAYRRLMRRDIGTRAMTNAISRDDLWVPAIPNLSHWFRRYVIVDLAKIHREILRRRCKPSTRTFLLIIFASILRNASNADPVPVSGLEVTAHMRQRDQAGRLIDPFSLLRRALTRGVSAAESWTSVLNNRPAPNILEADVTSPAAVIPDVVDAVITSPPYHNAVDYYRRHQLEMYWLGLTRNHSDRLSLLPRYIGRPKVRQSHPFLAEPWPTDGLAAQWEEEIATVSRQRAVDFRHYILAMTKVMRRLAAHTSQDAPVVIVIGQGTWNGARIPTVALIEEVSQPWFDTDETLWYPIRNRYMSYQRHNGNGIDCEHVLVLRRTGIPS